MIPSHGLNALAKAPESMRLLFRQLQKSSPSKIEANANILSLPEGPQLDSNGTRLVKYLEAPELQRSFRNFLEHPQNETSFSSLNPVASTALYEVEALPGLFIIPALLPSAVQIDMLNRLLHRDLSDPLHNTNLHLHYNITYDLGESTTCSISDYASDRSGSKTNHRSFFARNPSAKFTSKDPEVHRDITMKEVLDKKLRWVTLGGQYDWTTKRYPAEKPPPFPADMSELLRQIFPDVDPQAAILNLYKPGDTLSVHRDVSEECDQALVSISIGCDAVFIIGNEDGSSVVTLRLRSGDAVCMTGSSRFAWHAVPKILPDTCPTWLQAWPADVSETPKYESWRGWMAKKRINLNVRQMTAASY